MNAQKRAGRALVLGLLATATLGCPGGALASSQPSSLPVRTCQADNFSPASRTLAPVAVKASTGTVANPAAVLSGAATRLAGSGASLTLDFGKDVAGIVTLHFAAASDGSQSIGLAFTESPRFIGTQSDASEIDDGSLTAAVTAPGSYTMPANQLRGGFRYLTLFLQSSGWVEIDSVSLDFTAAPGVAHPNRYPNFFCSSDQLLNRIWYAGAYTAQLDTIDPTQGHVWPPPAQGWNNSGDVGVGSMILVDGAKRDRTAWPGDYGIAALTDLASLGDATSIRDGLTTFYEHQDPDGALPYAGPPINFPGTLSDTYSLWTLVVTYVYYEQTADRTWLDEIWPQYKAAVTYALAKIDPRGLMFVTGPSDWGNGHAGETIEANALLYHVLLTGAALADAERDPVLAATYQGDAAALRSAINQNLWDPAVGAYENSPLSSDATGSLIHPQDGNSLAAWFGVPDSAAKTQQLLAYLRSNWNKFGATAPEWNGNISPFPGGMELYAHFAGDDDAGGLALMRREWGYMLDSPVGTGSTFWEGYSSAGLPNYGPYDPQLPAGSYTSLAHGWSTGATGALTYDVLGIAPRAPGGRSFSVIPHPGDLAWADGRLTFPAGAVTVAWQHTATAFTLTVTDNGAGTRGVVALPRPDGSYVYHYGVSPGTHTFTWRTT